MTSLLNRIPSIALCAMMLSGISTAESASGEAQSAPDARGIVQEMSDRLKQMKSFRVNMSVVTRMEAEGRKQETATEYIFAVQRPDKVAQILSKGDMGMTVICDGKKVYTYMPMMSSYTVTDAPASLSELAGNLGLTVGDAIPAIRAFVAEDPGKALLEKVSNVSYLGADDVGGVKCHRLRFEHEQLDWEAWISADEKKLLMRIAPDFTETIAESRKEPGDRTPPDFKYEMILTLSDWVTEGELPADLFTFRPSAKSIQVDAFFPRRTPSKDVAEQGETQGASSADK